jgi:hypothetical protein
MSARGRSREQGQILVMTAAVMAFLFVPLSVFVIDSGLLESSYAQLGETLQASTEDGASMVDQDAFRQSNGQRVVLDPSAARATCERSIQTSGLPGIVSITVTVRANTITATATIRVRLLFVGAATLTETRSASFLYAS